MQFPGLRLSGGDVRLVSFTVTKYRSIKTAHKIQIGERTVLVGPNNEGKSNLLRALVTAMGVVRNARFARTAPSINRRGSAYLWERDYPQDLQQAGSSGKSEITLEFDLTQDDIVEFRRAVQSALNGTLPLKISLGSGTDPQITVVKRGPGGQALTAKSAVIARFVSERMNFEHIPAVRTAESAEEIGNSLVDRELETLESDPNYRAALESITELQQPLLDRLSESIKQTLVQFLPNVRDVKVQIPAEDRSRALRSRSRIIVDDGTPTLLQLKGDGVQSLAALGIMRHASESTASGRSSVIAIEEPESHLHPGAIHELRNVLQDLSARHQVVLTTHNPLFIDRTSLQNNVIVQASRARPARNIGELRTALGVRASDNLRHAELVLLVEGESDKGSVEALLRHHSRVCREALDSGILAIDGMGGAGNLSYNASLIRQALCQPHVFIDDDDAGRREFEKARTDGAITDGDTNSTICDGMAEAEMEDLYDPALYAPWILSTYRASLSKPEFRSAKKWSVRMAATFRSQGKPWNARIEKDVKAHLAELVIAKPGDALLTPKRGAFDGLVGALESRITELDEHRPRPSARPRPSRASALGRRAN